MCHRVSAAAGVRADVPRAPERAAQLYGALVILQWRIGRNASGLKLQRIRAPCEPHIPMPRLGVCRCELYCLAR